MILEFKVEQANWATLLPLVQGNLNHSPVVSLANHSPAEVFLGVTAATPLEKVLVGHEAAEMKVVEANRLSPDISSVVNELRASLEVLWSRIDSKVHINKLAVKWMGPYRVIGAHANSFEIEHLLSGTTRKVHASRLKMYADSSLDVNEEILERISNQGVYLTVAAFKDYREHPAQGYEVLVAWEGLGEIEDSWEPIKIMHEDVPVKLQDYVRTAGDSKLSQFLLQLQSARGSVGNQSTKKSKAKNPTAASKAIKNSRRRAKNGSSAARQQKPARRLAK